MVSYVSVVSIQPVFDDAVRRHVVRGLEAEQAAEVLDRHGHFLDEYLVVTPPQIFEIYAELQYDRY